MRALDRKFLRNLWSLKGQLKSRAEKGMQAQTLNPQPQVQTLSPKL